VNTTDNVGFCMEVETEVDWDACIKRTDDPEILNLGPILQNYFSDKCLTSN
jgi:hypothetical protein